MRIDPHFHCERRVDDLVAGLILDEEFCRDAVNLLVLGKTIEDPYDWLRGRRGLSGRVLPPKDRRSPVDALLNLDRFDLEVEW
jgi:hypothetical protein